MTWVDLGSAAGVEGTLREARAGDRLLGAAFAAGHWRVFDAFCTHAACLLTDGWLEGAAVRCACHAALFDLETGTVLDGPAVEPIALFDVRIEGGRLQARLPDSEAAA